MPVIVLLAVLLLILPALLCCWMGGWLLAVGLLSLAVWLGLVCWLLAGMRAVVHDIDGRPHCYMDDYADEYV